MHYSTETLQNKQWRCISPRNDPEILNQRRGNNSSFKEHLPPEKQVAAIHLTDSSKYESDHAKQWSNFVMYSAAHPQEQGGTGYISDAP